MISNYSYNKSGKYDIGKFREKIEIQELKNDENIVDDYGFVSESWFTIRTCFASVKYIKAKELSVMDSSNNILTFEFYIRNSRNVKISENNIIIYNGEKYKILYVIPIDNNQFLNVGCSVIRG